MRARTLATVVLLTLSLAGGTASAAAGPASPRPDRERVRGELLVRHQVGGPGSPCAPEARACLIGTARGDLTGDVRLDAYDARGREGSARRVEAATVDLTITGPQGRLDGIGVALLYAETRDQLTRVEWIGGTGPYAEATGAITVTGSARPIDETGLQVFPYKGTVLTPR